MSVASFRTVRRTDGEYEYIGTREDGTRCCATQAPGQMCALCRSAFVVGQQQQTLDGLVVASRPYYPNLSDYAMLQLLEARTRPGSYDVALEKLGRPEPPAYTGVPRPYDLALARRKAGGR